MHWVKIIFLLLIGFILLVKSSDIFVDAVSSIATNFKMSKMMIALTVAAFGTCAPELAISFNSIASGSGDIALANVLGSNVVNILLIIGLAACVAPIKVNVIKKELPILLVITSMFVLSILLRYIEGDPTDFILSRQDGFMFLCFFILFMIYIVSVVRAKQGMFENEKPKYGMIKSIILTIVCCIVIIFSSDLVVDNARELANMLNVTERTIRNNLKYLIENDYVIRIGSDKKGEWRIINLNK